MVEKGAVPEGEGQGGLMKQIFRRGVGNLFRNCGTDVQMLPRPSKAGQSQSLCLVVVFLLAGLQNNLS